MSTPENQKGTKNPITLKIKFKSGSVEQFIERYSVDVSRGGIFIRTKEPLAVGTPLRFEFQLQDGTPLISGDGTVVWNRAADPSRPTVVPGMGVRFDKLTPDSQRVLERILSDKEKQGTTQMESRFDAGVRASMASAEPAPSEETPKGGMFGDEPTRAMAADQVNKLAEAMQRGAIEEDMPTRAGLPSDVSDEVRKLAGQEGSGSLPAIPTAGLPVAQKLEPMRAQASNPMMRSTLLGQGFGLTPPATLVPPAGVGAPAPGLALDPLRLDPSNPVLAASKLPAAAAPPDSAVTPAKPAEMEAHVAESRRTPTGEAGSSRQSEATPTPAQAPVPNRTETSQPDPSQPRLGAAGFSALPFRNEAPIAEPALPMSTGATAVQPSHSSSSKGLLIGAALLILLVAAVGYFVLENQKAPPPENKTPPAETVPPPPPQPPPLLTPEKGAGDTAKPPAGEGAHGENTAKPAEGAAADSLELTTDPPGALVELSGKTVGTTPAKLPGLVIGKLYDLRITLRGYQEVRQKIKPSDDTKVIQIKLQPIERQVEIFSAPKGADVYVDGKKIGRTPWILRKVDLSKALAIEIRRPGFETWTHNLSDTEAFVLRNKKEVLTLNATLEPATGKPHKAGKADGEGDAAEPKAAGGAETDDGAGGKASAK